MFRLIDIPLFTFERLNQHRVLVTWVLVGLSVATTLALSLPLYVDSVYSELLESRLADPPYAFRFRYLGAWNGNVTREDVVSASAVIQDHFPDRIGLPVTRSVRFVRAGTWALRLDSLSLGTFSLGTLEGAADQITIVEGQWPPKAAHEDASLPVLAPEDMLYSMGLQVGDELAAQRSGGGKLTLRIAALWRPANPVDPTWIFTPKFFDQIFLLTPGDLDYALAGSERPVDELAWYLMFDGASLRASDIDRLLSHIVDGQKAIDTVLPGIRNDLSPVEGLKTFNREVDELVRQLFIIVAPVGGLVWYFVSLAAGLLVRRQGPDDVKLRSRGMSRRALLTVHVLMWLLLAGAALGIGLAASPQVVRLVGRTSSFLRFDSASSVSSVVLTPSALMLSAITGLAAASSGLFLAWHMTRQNINAFRQSTIRAGKAWWQRAYLDILLLIPAGYVLYTLRQKNGLVTSADTPFSDPLTFVGPTLFALGSTLLFLRLWPLMLNIVARLVGYSRSIALLMALRELTRSSGRYRGTLLMMAFTLSLTGFTASMASTIDRSLTDTVNYRVGADLVLVTAVDTEAESEENTDTGQTTYTVTGYNMPPIADLLAVDGVAYVSRVGRYPARVVVGAQRIDGTILGVDRAAMAAVARFREDYAETSLAGLLNQLAGQRTGVLLSRATAERYNVVVGQEIVVQVQALNTWYETRAPVVGLLDYFPTLDPASGVFLVANLDPIFEMVGTVLPHNFWLALTPGADPERVVHDLRSIRFPVIDWDSPNMALDTARAEPARRGVLGFLSVGFVASIVLTLIAAVIQISASFQAQSAQLGTLRAMGLGSLPVGVYVVILQGLAALSGILSGTAIGVATTLLFLPLLDFSAGLPPYLVRVAWDDITLVYATFAGVLFFVTLFTTLLLSREQVAVVIRLGEG